jgi:NAD(P)-dependent dehydrogenase (short-subunit alcohol dehydrogenase family)
MTTFVLPAGGQASFPSIWPTGRQLMRSGPLYERFGRLDAFVGSAAFLGALSPLPHIPSDHWDRVFAVNVTANWRLIRTLDPLLRRSDAARMIFVTSSVVHSAPAFWAPYSVSKAALEALARTMATRMRAEAYPREDQAMLPSPERVTEIFVKLAMAETEATGRIFAAGLQAS